MSMLRFREFFGERFVSLASLSEFLDEIEAELVRSNLSARDKVIVESTVNGIRKQIVIKGGTIRMNRF